MTLLRASRIGWLIVCVVGVACGAKGPPLPPLQRVPAAPDATALRYDQEIFITFLVPSANIEGTGPANIDRVEMYAITLAEALGYREMQTEEFRKVATLIATEHVRLPLPPTDPNKPTPPKLPEPGLDQGGPGVVRERLTDAALTVVTLPTAVRLANVPSPSQAPQRPPTGGATATTPTTTPTTATPETATAGTTTPATSPEGIGAAPSTEAAAPTFVDSDPKAPRRYYFAVGVTRAGRYGRTSNPTAVPLASATSAPSAPAVTYDEHSTTIRWNPSADAHLPDPPVGNLLPSRPLFAVAPQTKYDVFAVSRTQAAADAPPVAPTPLNTDPLATTELVLQEVRFGAERCFAVRPVDVIGELVVRGVLSEPTCETPRDTFPPAAPQSLAAIAGAGNISLIWDPNTEPDLAGYIVLRGEGSAERLTPLTPTPIRETTYRDTNVKPGVRYVYAIVAVDNASTQNVSAQSVRVEETARQ